MNNKGTAVQFIILIFLVALVTYLVYYLPQFNLDDSVVEKKKTCNLYFDSNDISVVEGHDIVFDYDFFSEFGGTYTISLARDPVFSSMESTFFAISNQKSSHQIIFTNATPLSETDLRTEWYNIKITAEGPSKCSGVFTFRIIDNCPGVFNPEQEDYDSDGIGDVCDSQTCGNLICESGENITNCCSDCGCVPGQECVDNNCTGTPYECSNNSDCKDNILCTRDVCFHGNTSDAHCGHTELTECSRDYSDGCCPAQCNNNIDIDCAAECGNGICEDFYYIESFSHCRKDCPIPKED